MTTTTAEREGWFPLRCDVVPERGAVRVAPHGEIDIATAPDLALRLREVVEAGFDHIVLDLREVRFLDSTGLRLVLGQDSDARAEGRTFRIIPGPASVQRVFDVACVAERLDFRPA